MAFNEKGQWEVERKLVAISDFSAGERLNPGDIFNIPAWKRIENGYIDEDGFLNGRPHAIPITGSLSNLRGLAISNNNTLLTVADNSIYDGNTPISSLLGSGVVSYDTSRQKTIITAGRKPVIIESVGIISMTEDNVYAVASFQGNKYRLCIVQSDNPRSCKISAIGDLTDFGEVIIDTDGFNDEYTEGIVIYNFPYDIVDVVEYKGSFIFLTKQAIFKLEHDVGETGIQLQLQRVRDIEIWDVKARKYQGSIVFMNSQGIWIYGETPQGIELNKLPMNGVDLVLLKEIVNGEASINLDTQRKLLYLTPSLNSGYSRVFHFDKKLWTKWDLPIFDLVEINSEVYCTVIDNDKVVRLDNNPSPTVDEPYDMILLSGLNDFDGTRSRKRYIWMGLEINTEDEFEYYLDVLPDSIPSTLPNPLTEKITKIENPLECYIGSQSVRGSIYMLFRNYGKFVLNNAYLDMKIKKPRIGLA